MFNIHSIDIQDIKTFPTKKIKATQLNNWEAIMKESQRKRNKNGQ